MSPPVDYQSPSPYEPPKRPASITFVGITAIILGAMGILCTGGGTVIGYAMNSSGMQAQPQGMLIANLALVVVSVLLSLFWIIGAIGVLSLRAWSRQFLLGLAAVDLIYDLAKFIVSIAYILPKTIEMIQSGNMPGMSGQQAQQAQSAIGIVRAFSYGQIVLIFLCTAIFAISVLLIMNRPSVKAALTAPEIPGSV
jgi:hypothetical protein